MSRIATKSRMISLKAKQLAFRPRVTEVRFSLTEKSYFSTELKPFNDLKSHDGVSNYQVVEENQETPASDSLRCIQERT